MRSRLSAALGQPFHWADSDSSRYLPWLALVGVGAAAATAAFGLPPLNLHGPLHRFGIMDPLCGGTRATRALALGDVGTALRFNPIVVLLPVGVVGIAVRAAIGLTTGRWLHVRVRRSPALLVLVVVATAALWVRQQLNADLLA